MLTSRRKEAAAPYITKRGVKMKKTLSFILCVSLIAAALCACSGDKSTKEERETALTVCGYDVPYEMLRYAALNALNDQKSAGLSVPEGYIGTEEGKEKNRELLDEALAALCITYGVFGMAKDRGIDPFGDAMNDLVEANMQEKVAAYTSDEELTAALAKSGMNRSVLRTLLRYEAVYTEIFDDMKEKGDIATAKDELQKIFEGDDFIAVKVLCFSTERHTIEECRALAAGAVEALDAGADFDEYVDEHGEMLEMFKNRDGLYVCRGVWRKELEDAAFALSTGERSEPIESPDGVRIMLRAEKSAEYIEENFDSLTDTYEEGVFRRAVEAAVDKASASVSVPGDFYDRSVFDMKVG